MVEQAGYMSIRTTAAYAELSERTIWNLIADPLNPLPSHLVGKRRLIKRVDFDSWMETHRVVGLSVEARIDRLHLTRKRRSSS
jgi:excisionase family DNA binding protein